MRLEGNSGFYHERFVKSQLDWVVLSILAHRPSYGYNMIKVINDEFRVYISSGSLYPILYDLERKGLVTGVWDSPDRHSKKIYELKASGTHACREGYASLDGILKAFRRREFASSGRVEGFSLRT